MSHFRATLWPIPPESLYAKIELTCDDVGDFGRSRRTCVSQHKHFGGLFVSQRLYVEFFG